MRAATGTKISSLLLLAPDGCHPTNNPQVDTVAKSWLGEQSASPLFLPKMPQLSSLGLILALSWHLGQESPLPHS